MGRGPTTARVDTTPPATEKTAFARGSTTIWCCRQTAARRRDSSRSGLRPDSPHPHRQPHLQPPASSGREDSHLPLRARAGAPGAASPSVRRSVQAVPAVPASRRSPSSHRRQPPRGTEWRRTGGVRVRTRCPAARRPRRPFANASDGRSVSHFSWTPWRRRLIAPDGPNARPRGLSSW